MNDITDITDITIIGGGPTGLFAMFYAGMRGVTSRIIDALPEPGGQLTALYPEKYIFDVAGFPKVLAKDFVKALVEQAEQFHHPMHFAEAVVALEEDSEGMILVTEANRFRTRSIIIAAGIGAFTPRRLPQPSAAQWYGLGIHDRVIDPELFRGQRVLIIGGGDSAFDWTHQLLDRAAGVTLIHRSDRFRAHAATVSAVSAAAAAGRAEILTFHELAEVHGNGDHLIGATIKNTKAKSTRLVECDVILPMLGFVSDMGPIAEWGLDIVNDEIAVSTTMDTGRPGIYAAGDVTRYPGKLKLIATGFAEAATAVNQAVHWIYPEKKVAPAHSSNMKLFGQSED